MIYRGRTLDPVSLWEQYVDFPYNMPTSGFAPLVVCPNPDHATSKRHYQINLDKPLVHCFANCGISGTYDKAIAMIEGVTEREARKIIVRSTTVSGGKSAKRGTRRAGKSGARTDKPDEVAVSGASLEFSRSIPQRGLDYLALRGIDAASIAAFEIGWDSDDLRIVIPAKDERGITRFLIKRAVSDKNWPKYLYWPELVHKTDVLFGACNVDLKQVRSHGLVLVEGSLDKIVFHQHGIRNVGAILGTKVSERQAQIVTGMRPRRIYCGFDKDISGWHNIQSAAQMFPKLPIFVCLYPSDKTDPATLSRREAHRFVESAIPLTEFKERLPKHLRKRREIAYG